MKITRRQLRQLIEATLNEQNPGSHFAAAETKGKETSEKEIKAKWSRRIQETYDWFMNEVFPAMKAGKKYIKSPDSHLVYGIGLKPRTGFTKQPSNTMQISVISPNTQIPLSDGGKFTVHVRGFSAKKHTITLSVVWEILEKIGANPDLDLDVAMTSDAGEALASTGMI